MGFKSSKGSRCRVGAAALFLLAACGGGGSAPPAAIDPDEPMDATSGTKRDAGSDAGRVEAGTQPDGATSESGTATGDAAMTDGPEVDVLSPAAADAPDSMNVITTGAVSVRCEVKQKPMGEVVDANTVRVLIYEDEKIVPIVMQKALSTAQANVYEAPNINLVDVPHGRIRIECIASDSAAHSTTTKLYTLYDKGPLIQFISPMEKGYVSAVRKEGEDLRVRFKVAPNPLARDMDDPGAAVSLAAIKAIVGGKPIPVIDASTEKDIYSFKLDFNDSTFFPVIPDTLSVRLEATNARKRTSIANLAVGVDNKGPTITVKSPLGKGGGLPIVSGKVDVKLEIKDALAGVDSTSVQVRLDKPGGQDVLPIQIEGDLYTASFETVNYPNRATVSLQLVARDNVGIETLTNLIVDIDPIPPWISLDPPMVRERHVKGTNDECSGVFDPLGANVGSRLGMVNDLDVVAEAIRPNALLWDRPLRITGVVSTVAMIDPSTARFYVQHNLDVPLLVDTDDDAKNECDQVNTSNENMKGPVVFQLTGIPATGTAPTPLDLTSPPSVSGLGCVATTGTRTPIAGDTILTRIIDHTAQGGGAVVWASAPAQTAGALRTTGTDYQTVKKGWACLTAAAKDYAGNYAFAPPIRVCFDDGSQCTSVAPPTCTDGCVIPAQFDKDAPDAMPQVLTYDR